MAQIKRLHIGAKNLIEIPEVSWKVLSQDKWIHLGSEKPDLSSFAQKANSKSVVQHAEQVSYLDRLYRTLRSKIGLRRMSIPSAKELINKDFSMWENSKLIPWYYRKGDALPFDDETFSFVYSEHFFKHLFLDEAIYLFREIYRVMAKGAVCRTVVPDADLRTYEAPEPVGYPGENMAWGDPEKHKIRWSFSVLDEVFKISSFDSRVGLVYCMPDSKFINRTPNECKHEYSGCIDSEVIFDMSYIARPKSLIVDAIKK